MKGAEDAMLARVPSPRASSAAVVARVRRRARCATSSASWFESWDGAKVNAIRPERMTLATWLSAFSSAMGSN